MADKPQHSPGFFPVPSGSDAKSRDHEIHIQQQHSGPAFSNNNGSNDNKIGSDPHGHTAETPLLAQRRPFRFLTTWQFWGILILGQILSWCIVSTNTLTQYLVLNGANIPAFQTVFNYALLALVYTPWTFYKYGLRKWIRMVVRDGWKYFILAFVDVQGVQTIYPRRN
jgi:solute carrier family 35, member F1/2